MPLLLGGDGINVYRPVYRDGEPTATVAEREAALLGFAAGAFRVHDLAAAAISTLPDDGRRPAPLGQDASWSGPRAPRRPGPGVDHDRQPDLARCSSATPDRPSVGLPLLVAVFGILL